MEIGSLLELRIRQGFRTVDLGPSAVCAGELAPPDAKHRGHPMKVKGRTSAFLKRKIKVFACAQPPRADGL
jgi:hypothetical protein